MVNTNSNQPKKIILAITGASGVIYGIRALEVLRKISIETHLIVSTTARLIISTETDWALSQLESLSINYYEPEDLGAKIASGSFTTQGMAIIPCSIKTLSAIANSYANSLITRAADVTLKEGRPLILVVRETPLHKGHLRIMSLAVDAGAIIFPPVPAFYQKPKTIEEIISSTVERILMRLGIEVPNRPEWAGINNNE